MGVMVPLILFFVLSAMTTVFLFKSYGLLVLIQYLLILLVSLVGEQIISSWGYYHYTNKNHVFIGPVPASIPFFWVFFIQFSLIVARNFFSKDFGLIFFSSLITLLLDSVFIEPYLSKKKGYWVWTPRENGMFNFVPKQVNRFTAPFGNYFTWFMFPFLMNALLIVGVKFSGVCLGTIF